MAISLENMSELPQQIIFYPLPKEISVEMDLIPIKILPNEKFTTNFIYRSGKIVDNKKDESFLNCKIITGTIQARDIRIPYFAEIKKCPIELSAQKIDFRVLQIDESYSMNLSVKNVSFKDIIYEFFLPMFDICGIKMTPMVGKLA